MKKFIRLLCMNKETIIATDSISYIDREDTKLYIKYKHDNLVRSYSFNSSHEAFMTFNQIWEELEDND